MQEEERRCKEEVKEIEKEGEESEIYKKRKREYRVLCEKKKRGERKIREKGSGGKERK